MQEWYPYTSNGVFIYAPRLSGVYAIRALSTMVVYVGESQNIHDRMSSHVSHLSDRSNCIALNGGYQFSYEHWSSPYERRSRERQLIAMYNPPCNQGHYS